MSTGGGAVSAFDVSTWTNDEDAPPAELVGDGTGEALPPAADLDALHAEHGDLCDQWRALDEKVDKQRRFMVAAEEERERVKARLHEVTTQIAEAESGQEVSGDGVVSE
jgi:outer membrane murein-binding lipoprotein Lpp